MSLHRLVQAVLRDEMDSNIRRMWAERAVRALNVVFPYGDYSTWALCDRLISHAQALASPIDEYGFDFPEAGRLMNQAGDYLDERAQYAEAEPLCKRALGPEHPHTVKVLENYAALLREMGREDEVDELEARGALRRGPDSGPDGGFDRCAARGTAPRRMRGQFSS